MEKALETSQNTFETSCPQCGQTLGVPAELAGLEAPCPACGALFVLPAIVEGAPADPAAVAPRTPTCIHCGAMLSPGGILCIICGTHQKTGKRLQLESSAPAPGAKKYTAVLIVGVVLLLLIGGFLLTWRHGTAWPAAQPFEVLAPPPASQSGTGILPVIHGRDAYATRSFAKASFDYASLLYDETNHPAKVAAPFPWQIPPGYHLWTQSLPNTREEHLELFKPLATDGMGYTGYFCCSGNTVKVFINGIELSQFQCVTTNIVPVTFSKNGSHWMAISAGSNQNSSGLLVDGKLVMTRLLVAAPVISADGRHSICSVFTANNIRSIVVDGVECPSLAGYAGHLFAGANNVTVFENGPGRDGVLGTRHYTSIQRADHGNAAGTLDHAAYIVGSRGDQFVWADGVEYAHFDEIIQDESLKIHPVSGKLQFTAKRAGKPYAFFDGKLLGPYDQIMPSFGGSVLASPDGLHYALLAQHGERTFTVYDGVEEEHASEQATRLLNPNCRCKDLEKIRHAFPYCETYLSADRGHIAYATVINRLNQEPPRHQLNCENGRSPEFETLHGDPPVVFSPDYQKVAYVACRDGQWFVGINGVPGPEYDTKDYEYPQSLQFTPNSIYLFCEVQQKKGGYFLVVNLKPTATYEQRISRLMVLERGVGAYVLNGNAISFVKGH